MNLYSTRELTLLLEKHGFSFKKKLGQNFLLNESIADRIAAASRETIPETEKCLALEIGPGAGSLTCALAKRFDRVFAIEIDPVLIGVLEESLADLPNVTVENADALKFDFSAVREKDPDCRIAVCSNLPYYLTSEIIMRFLETGLEPESVTVLIQKEAAERLTAKPGTAEYGAITAAVSFYAEAKRLFNVSPGNFTPRPKVDSAVLRLTPYRDRPVKPRDLSLFFAVIRAAFSARRKTLSNALSAAFPERDKNAVLRALEKAGVDPARRGETLSAEEFCRISDNLSGNEEK